jgi:hypothetical protein
MRHLLRAGAVLFLCGSCKGGSRPTEPGQLPPEARTFSAYVFNGMLFPSGQFHRMTADSCNADHLHANPGHPEVVSIARLDPTFPVMACQQPSEQVRLRDPDPGGCGFGRVTEVPLVSSAVSQDCWNRWVGANT